MTGSGTVEAVRGECTPISAIAKATLHFMTRVLGLGLLGYRFCPRIADIGGARFWRIDPSADYGLLNGVARHRIRTKLIEEHWDDMLRLAGSLKLGTVQAISIMKTLRVDDHPTKLAQAVVEVGRIDKTIHALSYISDENKRRRT